jgi:hypothetical protein
VSGLITASRQRPNRTTEGVAGTVTEARPIRSVRLGEATEKGRKEGPKPGWDGGDGGQTGLRPAVQPAARPATLDFRKKVWKTTKDDGDDDAMMRSACGAVPHSLARRVCWPPPPLPFLRFASAAPHTWSSSYEQHHHPGRPEGLAPGTARDFSWHTNCCRLVP